MKQHRNRLYFLTALAVMTNGFSLIGWAHGSVGAVAKNIEANHNMSRGITTELALRGHSGNPPQRDLPQVPAPFKLDCLEKGTCVWMG
ncbi:hypothetical protein [Pseudomonas sp. LFM046]|uniref:hypothetical protein n=1 Tax=Pseudomonas sp. LFM046 TaxID=1608357 RepID=UPI0005CFA18A|nr:hypothetical protein [Pseudomonas sp. LFM046]